MVPISSYEDIVAEILDPEEDNEIDKDVAEDVEGPNRPYQILNWKIAIDKLYNLSFFSLSYGSKLQSLCLKMKNVLCKTKLDRLR